MLSDIMTLREVADYLKVNKQTIYRMLIAKQIPSFKVRSEWRFKKEAIDEWIAQGAPERDAPGRLPLQDKQDKPANPERDWFDIPVLGRIAAGSPILAEENIEGTVRVARKQLRDPDNVFALRVQGESMINAGINDGDIILIRQQPTAENGEMVAVMIDNEATVKRFYLEKGKIRLQPENDTMPPIIIDPEDKNVRIAGKVEKIIKQERPKPASTVAILSKDEIFRQLRAHQDTLDKYNVKRIGLFGSYARSEQTPASDIDFVVEFGEPDFDNFMNLNYFLDDLFGKKVEILTPAGLSPHIKHYIEKELIWHEK
jgi:SOS regulatory protein LexA